MQSVAEKRKSALWKCEELEIRRLFATVSWITHGDGDWSTPANWSTGTVPQAGDNVIIDVPGVDLTVTYSNSAVLALGNLTNNEVLDLSGSNGATWNGGVWQGSGVVNNTSTIAIGGSANKTIQDGLTITNGGTITMDGTGNIVGAVGASIINDPGAIFNFLSDADIVFPTGVGDGIFENGGLVEKTGGTGVSQIGGPQGFTYENCIDDVNNRSLDVPGDTQVQTGTLELGTTQDSSYTAGGTFEISAGATLDYSLGIENIVILYPPSPATPVVPSITGAGTLEVSGGTVQMYGTVAVHEIDVNGGALLLQQNMTALAGTPQSITDLTDATASATTDILNLSGGTIGGNGGGIFSYDITINQNANAPVTPSQAEDEQMPALVVGTTFAWTGGGFAGTGRIVIPGTVTSSTISGTAAKFIDGGFGLDLLVDTDWTDSGTINMNGDSVLDVAPAATLDDEANGTFVEGTVDAQGGEIWNNGIILKQGGTGTTSFGNGIDVINDYGQIDEVSSAHPYLAYAETSPTLPSKIDIRSGTLSLGGTSINRNNILIHAGATLSYDGGSHINQTYNGANDVADASILGVDGGGSIVFGAASFTSDSQSLVDVPTATFGTGSYSFDNVAAGAQRLFNVTFNGGNTGQITGNGTIEVVDSFAWNSGTFVGTGSGSSSLLIDAGAIATLASGNYSTSGNYSIVNDGTIGWETSPGTLSVVGNYTQASTGAFDCEIVQGVPDSLTVSGTVTIAGALNLSVGNFTPFGGETYTIINNTGTGPIVGTFNGDAEGKVLNISGDVFQLTYLGGDGNDVMLTSFVTPTITIQTPSVIVRPLVGTSELTFAVSLSAATNVVVTVHYATTPGTAVAGRDYTTTDGTLTFAIGETTANISVPIIGTTAVAVPLTFTLTLSSPVDGNLGTPSSAVGTIAAINGPPVLSLFESFYTVDENAGFATIVVTSSNPAIASTVHYATQDGTALAGVDYTATTGTLTFATGVSRMTFNVPIIDIGAVTGQKTFTVVLSNPTGNGATLGTPTALVTILDNDGSAPTLSINDPTVTELVFGQTEEVFTLSLNNPSTSAISVDYTTADGSAREGKYVAQSGTITLAPNQTTATISVPINSDFVQNSVETFTVNLSNPVNVSLGKAVGTGTIINQTLTTVAISAGHPFTYVDALGKKATIALTGPGTGVVTYLGLTIDDGKQIVLDGTTTASGLSIRTTAGQTALVNLIVNGSIGSVNASVASVFGDVTISGGVKTLKFNSLLGGNQVNIGSGGGINTVNATFYNVSNATLISAIPFGTLHVNNWLAAGTGTGISAPSANVIIAVGDFDSDIALSGNLNTMTVGKNLNASVIRVGGNIKTIKAGTLTTATDIAVDGNLGTLAVKGAFANSSVNVAGNITSLTALTFSGSSIYAGVADSVSGLPTTSSQFTNTTSSIGKLTVTSKALSAFADTDVAAPVLGTLQLGSIAVSNGGTPFGVATTTEKLVQGKLITGVFKLKQSDLAANPFSSTDLVIELTD